MYHATLRQKKKEKNDRYIQSEQNSGQFSDFVLDKIWIDVQSYMQMMLLNEILAVETA